ncbi:MAG: methyltransferase domain-containing protein, partial [Actinobacteria bacterium]|nr:methyltransferase domain-containing protein [Actinomycetota bacterium]
MSVEDPFTGRAAWFADHYLRGRGRARLELVMDRLLPALPPPPAKVLDAGGGTGAFALPLARRGYVVTLLDRSGDWLEEARRCAAEEGLRVELIEGPAERALDLVGDGFDAVLAHTLLVYSEDPRRTLSALRSTARSGAVLSLLEKNRASLALRPGLTGEYDEALRVLDDPISAGRLEIPNRSRSMAELRSLLVASGWQPRDWTGIRLFSDGVPDDIDEASFASVLRLDRAIAAREPYRRVARLLHLLAVAEDVDRPSLGAVQAHSVGRAARSTRASWPPDRSLSSEGLLRFLDRKRYAVLSTARPDGRPHAAMVAFCLREGVFWLPSVAGSARLRNLAAEPWATLVVSEGEGEEHVAVVVEGDALVHDEPGPLLDGFLRDAWKRKFGTDLTT